MPIYDRQTEPGLVALYNIQPGNRAGLFIQPWIPHRAQPKFGYCLSRTASTKFYGCTSPTAGMGTRTTPRNMLLHVVALGQTECTEAGGPKNLGDATALPFGMCTWLTLKNMLLPCVTETNLVRLL